MSPRNSDVDASGGISQNSPVKSGGQVHDTSKPPMPPPVPFPATVVVVEVVVTAGGLEATVVVVVWPLTS